jgi:hypothetical protein
MRSRLESAAARLLLSLTIHHTHFPTRRNHGPARYKSARANALTQATLAKAFRGGLVPTEAALAAAAADQTVLASI